MFRISVTGLGGSLKGKQSISQCSANKVPKHTDEQATNLGIWSRPEEKGDPGEGDLDPHC